MAAAKPLARYGAVDGALRERLCSPEATPRLGTRPCIPCIPLQRAFIEHDGFQCGYCTPGQICSAVGMMAELERGVPSHVTVDLSADMMAASRDELRERMSGNLCRCGAHNGIIDAIASIYAEAAE